MSAGEPLALFAEGLWLHMSEVRFYGVRLPTRASVVRLADGGLLVHSPPRPDAALRSALDALGPVRHVVSPNKIHHLGIAAFAAAYPGAGVWASPGLPERRPDLRFRGVLGDRPEPDWAGDLDQACTRGNVFFEEVVFLHRASGTLVVADLVERLVPEALPAGAAFFARALRLADRALASPEHRAYTVDVEAAGAAFDRMLAWDFDAIVLAHGELVRRGGKETLRRVRDHLLREVRERPAWKRRLYGWAARVQ